MIRIVIADDHTVVREGLKQMLSACADICVVGEASNGHEVLARLQECPCDLLLLEACEATGVSADARWLLYHGVRIGGAASYHGLGDASVITEPETHAGVQDQAGFCVGRED